MEGGTLLKEGDKIFLFTRHVSEEKRRCLSRLDVAKVCLNSFLDKQKAFDSRAHIGLVTFGDEAELKQILTETHAHPVHHTAHAHTTPLITRPTPTPPRSSHGPRPHEPSVRELF